jgi:hypothetical protein
MGARNGMGFLIKRNASINSEKMTLKRMFF